MTKNIHTRLQERGKEQAFDALTDLINRQHVSKGVCNATIFVYSNKQESNELYHKSLESLSRSQKQPNQQL